jgi:hypothetical protein
MPRMLATAFTDLSVHCSRASVLFVMHISGVVTFSKIDIAVYTTTAQRCTSTEAR